MYADVEIGDDFECGHHVKIREGSRIGDGVRVGTAFNRLLALPGARVIDVVFDVDGVRVGVALTRRRLVCSRCGQI